MLLTSGAETIFSGGKLQKTEIFFLRGSSSGWEDRAMIMSGWIPAEFSVRTEYWVGLVFISPRFPGTGR